MRTCLHCLRPIHLRPSRLDPDRNLWTSPSSSIPLVCWKRAGAVKDHEPAPSVEEQIEEAYREYETALEDAKGDYPDVHEDDLAHEMVGAVTFGLPATVANAVKRRAGFLPDDF